MNIEVIRAMVRPMLGHEHRKKEKKYWQRWHNTPQYKKMHHMNQQRYASKVKLEAFNHYSGGAPKCAHCGVTDIDVLCLDHLNNDGAKQRRETGIIGGVVLYCRLRQSGYPDGYQVLCFNCNMKKRIIHEREEANERN